MEFLTPFVPKSSIKPALKETYYPKQKELFKSLFINGITIIGGDTSVSNSFPPNEDRLLAYNYTSVKNYREYIESHKELEENPVIFLCGARHVEETKYIKSITSLLEEAPAVSVFLRDNYKGKIEHVSVKKKSHAFEITIEKSIEALLKTKDTFSFVEKIKEEKNIGKLAR